MLDMSIAQPIWPAVGLCVAVSLIVGAMVGRLFGQWRMFIFAMTSTWSGITYAFLPLPFWTILGPFIGGMAFVAVAWFRERNRLMGDVTN